jgi:hypothetical protein
MGKLGTDGENSVDEFTDAELTVNQAYIVVGFHGPLQKPHNPGQ